MSDSVRPHRRQPTRLPRPWDSPGKNTGVGCHFLLQCMKVKSESEVAQLRPTLRDPMDCSPPGSSTHGILQARVLEWAAKEEQLYSIMTTAIIIFHCTEYLLNNLYSKCYNSPQNFKVIKGKIKHILFHSITFVSHESIFLVKFLGLCNIICYFVFQCP